jgi:steroid 5-alpha reductase family enzyme
MTASSALILLCVAASVGMALLFLLERRLANASHVDAGWSGFIGLFSLAILGVADGDVTRRIVTGIIIGAWSLRLTWYLLKDRVINRPEDGRYADLRASWGERAGLWFFWFFQLQAGFVIIFTLPVWVIAYHAAPFGSWTDIVALCWFGLAFIGVITADHQLARWRADKQSAGKTCRAGLWSVSRHPNYFFEFLLWWSYAWLAYTAAWFSLTIVVPLFLLALLLGLTGIPYNEKRALQSRGDDYRRYQREVSAFIPWFPKK